MTTRLVPWFIRSGVVRAEERPRFAAIVRDVVRLRGGTLPWELIVAAVLAWTFFGRTIEDMHELAFAGSAAGGQAQLGFGGRWFLWVLRPIYVVLLLAWGWRLVLLALFFARVAKRRTIRADSKPGRFRLVGGVRGALGTSGSLSQRIARCTAVAGDR